MEQQILLFWVVLAGLLFFDNLVLLPSGADYLKVGREARLVYEPKLRFKIWRRDLVLLNPLNPFDRLVTTTHAIGTVTAEQLRAARKRLRTSLRAARLLSWLGSGYLFVLLVLSAVSQRFYFGTILLVMAVMHAVFWAASIAVMASQRQALNISAGRVSGLAFEALLVPGYLVNLSKRVWFKQTLNLAALTVGLRSVRHMPSDSRELYCLRMASRLDDVAHELGLPLDDAARSTANNLTDGTLIWFREARKCLTASHPLAG